MMGTYAYCCSEAKLKKDLGPGDVVILRHEHLGLSGFPCPRPIPMTITCVQASPITDDRDVYCSWKTRNGEPQREVYRDNVLMVLEDRI